MRLNEENRHFIDVIVLFRSQTR